MPIETARVTIRPFPNWDKVSLENLASLPVIKFMQNVLKHKNLSFR